MQTFRIALLASAALAATPSLAAAIASTTAATPDAADNDSGIGTDSAVSASLIPFVDMLDDAAMGIATVHSPYRLSAQAGVWQDGSASGIASWATTIVNIGNAAQAYDFEFTIDGGSVFLGYRFGADPLGADDEGYAEFHADIVLTGAGGAETLFDTRAWARWDDGIGTIGASGDGLGAGIEQLDGVNIGWRYPGYDPSNPYVGWERYFGLLSLGTLDPGESFSLSYTLRTTATLDSAMACTSEELPDPDGPGPGYGSTLYHNCYMAAAAADNPSGLPELDPIPVPEPAPVALLAAGLAGLGLARRRRS